MRDWRNYPPSTASEATQHRRDVLELLRRYVNGDSYLRCFPEPGKLQTPWRLGRRGTGMKEKEFAQLRKVLNVHKGEIWALWLDEPVCSPKVINDHFPVNLDAYIWYSWLPRLDAVMITDALTVTTCEIVHKLTASAIGELVAKTDIYMACHPKGPDIRAMVLVYHEDNPLVRALYLEAAPDYVKQLLRFEQAKIPPSRNGDEQGEDTERTNPPVPNHTQELAHC